MVTEIDRTNKIVKIHTGNMDLYDMAEVASRLTGDEGKFFTGFDISTKLKPIGVDVASFGKPLKKKAPFLLFLKMGMLV